MRVRHGNHSLRFVRLRAPSRRAASGDWQSASRIGSTRAGAARPVISRKRLTSPMTNGHHHPNYLCGAGRGDWPKGRFVSAVETVVGLTNQQNEGKKPNDFWSEWQDSNLRPLRPGRVVSLWLS